ncbi:glycosyltransferase family 2 protein [Thiohalobacter thiocyanaticus]|uniref:Glycosyltransferase family 2 protein n=1 Tax=Thiohalobacter thiocyanaticus TaxID=585455 RepID=A0A426QIP8_9GAMM|nr:glycosyltransferase family 2 protein [Thiohalobacter thiocyanaticus]RRQ21642.1 glycosyltransferase family 2 protein [Thiohalobacter thiocyanaticus]
MKAEPRFWFAIPVHNRIELTRSCLQSIRKQVYRNFRIVVCDDGSEDGTAGILAADFPEVVVLNGDGNLWWTGATNECVKYILENAAPDDYLITLNNDLELAVNYLGMMAKALEHKPDAVLASASYDIAQPDRLVEPGERMDWVRAKVRKLDPVSYDYSGLAEITHAPGRGTVFPLRVFSSIGLFDFEGLPQYAADYDFTHRARRAGFRVYMNYDAKLYSHVDHTGSSAFKGGWSLNKFYGYLTSIKSPGCLKYRWRFARKNCPRLLLPSYIVLDTARVLISYLLKRRWRMC